MTDAVYRFNSAIVREPARSVVDGLRADDRGNPTYEGVRAEHAAYVSAMRAAGVEITLLPAPSAEKAVSGRPGRAAGPRASHQR